MKNKSITLIWTDDEVKNSYYLCLFPYKLKLLRESLTENEFETEITLYGSVENIKRFLADFEDGTLEPFEMISRKFEYCDDYYNYISQECENFKTLCEREDSQIW